MRDIRAGQALGKYRLERMLGRGGMGEVWAALDPDLDRRVAIKVLRGAAAASDDARARLQREGRALAKLRHPNVITVHDAAFAGGHGLIAMELIDGTNLAGWLASPHSRRENVGALVAAGRGLAAAHAAGLVHRDFKPHNVLVETGGRILVTDFGLARATRGDAPPAPSRERADDPAVSPIAETATPDASGQVVSIASAETAAPVGETVASTADLARHIDRGSAGSLDSPLTEAGALLGTPLYMAPEQLAGGLADARADQFAFCVTMWEALSGKRPFRAETIAELEQAIQRGEVRHAELVPRRLRKRLVRGLAPDPAARWPSMVALLDALERAWRRPRRLALASAGLAAAASTAIAFAVVRAPSLPPCADPDVALAEVWSPKIRADFVAKLAGTDFAARSFGYLDRWNARWRELDHRACEARDTTDGIALRSCLDAVRDHARNMLALRDRILPIAYDNNNLMRLMPSPEMCAHNPRAAMPSAPPPERAEAVAAVRRDLVAGLVIAYQVDPALVERARATGYPPVIAEALIGSTIVSANGCSGLDEADAAAEAATYDWLRGWVAISRLACMIRRSDPPAVIDPAVRHAHGIVDRLGDPALGHAFEMQLSRIALDQRRWTESLHHAEVARVRAKELDVSGGFLDSNAFIEVRARLGRHFGDDLERARAAIAAAPIDSNSAHLSRALLAWHRGELDETALLPAVRDPRATDVAFRVVAHGAAVAGAVVRVSRRQVDIGARLTMFTGSRPASATTDAAGAATLPAKPGWVAMARAGDRMGLAIVGDAGPVTIALEPAVAVDGTVTGLGAATPDDPGDDTARVRRRTLPIATLSSKIRPAFFAAPVDADGHWHAMVPPGDYVVGVQVDTAAMDTVAVQKTVAVTGPQHVELAMPEAPDALAIIVRPAGHGWFVVIPGDAPPATARDLVRAIRAAPIVAAAQIAAPPASVKAEDHDGYVVLTRPAPGPLVGCAVTDPDPAGEVPAILDAAFARCAPLTGTVFVTR